MRINEIVDKAYYINLARRADRNGHAYNQLINNNIQAERFEAVDGYNFDKYQNLSRGAAGCLESQLSILKLAIENNFNSVAIFEDDVFFVDDFENKFSEFYEQVPSDWQFIYLANNKFRAKVYKVSDKVERVEEAWSAHAFLIRRQAMEVAVDIASLGDVPIDVYYGIIQKHMPAYSSVPSLAGQKADHSDIENVFIDYNIIYGL